MNTRLAIVIGLVLGGSNLATAAAAPAPRRATTRADAETLFEIGESSDPRQAFHWYTRAASLGHVEAMNRLGVMYAEGSGLPRDYAAALEWYRRAAAHGSDPAICNLGIGGERDDIGGYALIQAAVDSGIPASIHEVALAELREISGRPDEVPLARALLLARETLTHFTL